MPDQNRELPQIFQSRSVSPESAELTRAYPPLRIPRTVLQQEPSRSSPRRNRSRMIVWIVLIAFAIRLIVVLCTYKERLNPVMDYWFLGQEEGHVAKSIVQGHGFGNPLYTQTGPTAWFAPIYPYILAADFKVFGIFTTSSCIAILLFDALVSSLTCIPIFFFARRAFGEGAALAAAWTWAFYPGAVYWPIYRVWDTWLATLLLAILFCVVLKLARSSKLSHWIGFGLLSGIVALTDPSVLSVLPILALWAVWRLHQQRKRWFAPAVAAVLAVIVVVSPWMIRNAVVFHKFIPIRDNLPLEFRVGNNGSAAEPLIITAGPWVPWIDNAEWNDYVNLGEIAYFHQKGEQASAYIKAHPVWYVGMMARRVVYIWTGFWSFGSRYMADPEADHRIEFVTVPLLALLSVLTFMGLSRAYKQKGATIATPYALILIFFPLIYYLTHVGGWYRCPMDPFLITLAAYEVESRAAAWLRRRSAIRAAYKVPAMLPPTREELPAITFRAC